MYMYLCIELDASKCKVINTLVILNKFTGTPPNILVISNEWAWMSHWFQLGVSVPLISIGRQCPTHLKWSWARVSHSFQLRPSVPLISNMPERPTHLKWVWARVSHSSQMSVSVSVPLDREQLILTPGYLLVPVEYIDLSQ